MSLELHYSLSHLSADDLNKELDQLWTEALADSDVRKNLQALGEDPLVLQAVKRADIIEIKGRDEAGFDPISAIIVALLCGAAKKIGEKGAVYLWNEVILPRLHQDKGPDSFKPQE